MGITIWLPGEKPKSWNTLKRYHWTRWQDEVDSVKLLMLSALYRTLGERRDDWPLFENPVRITVTAYQSGRLIDASNVPAKLYEDGLLGLLLKDDNPAHVAEIVTRSRKAEYPEGPGVEVRVDEVGA